MRRAITATSVHIDLWNFDFDGPLLNDAALQAFDLGNVSTEPMSLKNSALLAL